MVWWCVSCVMSSLIRYIRVETVVMLFVSLGDTESSFSTMWCMNEVEPRDSLETRIYEDGIKLTLTR